MKWGDRLDKGAFSLGLGRRISDARMGKNIKADKLAEAAGITTQAMSNIECGKVDCKSSTLLKICTALGASSDYILGMEQRKTSTDIPILLSKLNDDEVLIVEQLIRGLAAIHHK